MEFRNLATELEWHMLPLAGDGREGGREGGEGGREGGREGRREGGRRTCSEPEMSAFIEAGTTHNIMFRGLMSIYVGMGVVLPIPIQGIKYFLSTMDRNEARGMMVYCFSDFFKTNYFVKLKHDAMKHYTTPIPMKLGRCVKHK